MSLVSVKLHDLENWSSHLTSPQSSHSHLRLARLCSVGANGRDPSGGALGVQDVEGEPTTLVHSCFF